MLQKLLYSVDPFSHHSDYDIEYAKLIEYVLEYIFIIKNPKHCI